MPVLPGGRDPDLIDDDANLPENSVVAPDEAPLDVPGSPSAGGWATSYLLPPKLGRSSRPVRFTGRTGTDSRVARVGPTTPTHPVGVRFGLLSHQEPSRVSVAPTSPIAARRESLVRPATSCPPTRTTPDWGS